MTQSLQRKKFNLILFDTDEGDITKEHCFDHYLDENISHIFHLAGKTFVPESWDDPYPFFQVNVIGTLNVLEFCRKKKASLTFLSSYPYGAPEYLPIDERHRLEAFNPYGHSKLIAEELCQYYLKNLNLRSTILRLFNVYGPGQQSSFLIPELIRKITDPGLKNIEVLDIRPRRDYIYIDDVIKALMLSIDGKAGIYNVGSGKSVSVEEIIYHLMRLMNIRKPIKNLDSPRKNEILDLYADIRLIDKELGWKPFISINDGLGRCVAAFNVERS